MINLPESLFMLALNFYDHALSTKMSVRQKAYVTATVNHETGGTFMPIKEIQGEEKYYAPYYGRSFFQLTHQANYERIGKYLYNRKLIPTADFLVDDPDQMYNYHIGMVVLVLGMNRGWPTGKKLSDYISEDEGDESKCDFYNARRIINGTDRATHIAEIAEMYLERLIKKGDK